MLISHMLMQTEDPLLIRLDNPGILFTPHHYSAAWDCHSLKRKAEFAAGRLCAAKAIENLDSCLPRFVDINPDGSPRWPEGIVGTITHTEGFVSAAVARSRDCLSLGIDSEKIMDTQTMRSAGEVAVTDEERLLFKHLPLSESQLIALIFSAKESIYKCAFPIMKCPPDFSTVMLNNINLRIGTFSFRFTDYYVPDSPAFDDVDGRFEFSHGCVHTAVEILQKDA